jgi:hypothetical protein
MKENNNAISPAQILYPVILLCVSFLLLMAFQMSQIMRDRASLNDLRAQQEKGIEDSQRIQAQLVALIVGTQKLASEGDEHAQKIVDKLKAIGVIPQAQPQVVPPQSTMKQPGLVPAQPPAPQAASSQPPMPVPMAPVAQPRPQEVAPAPQPPAAATFAEPVAPAPVPVAAPEPGPVKP